MSEAVATPKKRSKRDPERTREQILEVAGKLLAKDGPEGLSVSQVAQLAGINRGTAYHHFQTREQLLEETKAWVSKKLCVEVFGCLPGEYENQEQLDPREVTGNLTRFAMENPEFGRVWLFEVLSSSRPASDPFWHMYKTSIDEFVDSDLAQPGIDKEVHAVLMLVGVFLWPVWARAHANTAAGRRKMTKRYTDEILRFIVHGALNKDMFPDLEVDIKVKPKAKSPAKAKPKARAAAKAKSTSAKK